MHDSFYSGFVLTFDHLIVKVSVLSFSDVSFSSCDQASAERPRTRNDLVPVVLVPRQKCRASFRVVPVPNLILVVLVLVVPVLLVNACSLF